MINVTLTAYNMGSEATEADFDAWASYVAEHIDEALDLTVEVDQHGFPGGPAEDTIQGATSDQRDEIRRYLAVDGWEAFCSSMAA